MGLSSWVSLDLTSLFVGLDWFYFLYQGGCWQDFVSSMVLGSAYSMCQAMESSFQCLRRCSINISHMDQTSQPPS
jgi:hypothetical protein